MSNCWHDTFIGLPLLKKKEKRLFIFYLKKNTLFSMKSYKHVCDDSDIRPKFERVKQINNPASLLYILTFHCKNRKNGKFEIFSPKTP